MPADLMRREPHVLDAVCLLATGNEIDSGEFETFIGRMLASLRQSAANRTAAAAMTFNVMTLDGKKLQAVWTLRPYFKAIKILRSQIPKKFNFYHRQAHKLEDVSPCDATYGLKSAPNYHFFETMPMLREYNTALLLETDCYLGDDWLARLQHYAQHSGGFWISGATYSGLNMRPLCDTMARHINGGTALYAVGHPGFQEFIQFCHKVSRKYFQVAPWLPYDCLLDQIISDHYEHDKKQRMQWQFIASQYRGNNLILNYSPERDRGMSAQKLRRQTRYAVLHKKDCVYSSETHTPVFLHFPKCGGTDFYYRTLAPTISRLATQEFSSFAPVNLALKNAADQTVLGAVATGPNCVSPAQPENATVSMPIDEFVERVYRNQITNILAFKFVSNSDYVQHWSLVQRLCSRKPLYLTLLRQPLSRYESEFYYLRDMGTWEPTYGRFGGMTFAEYVQSAMCLDNWLVRRLNNILAPEIPVTDLHLRRAISLLEKCAVLGFLEAANAFYDTCAENFGYYNLPDSKILNRNTISEKITLTPETREYFAEKCRYDEQLYQHFWTQCVNGVVIQNRNI